MWPASRWDLDQAFGWEIAGYARSNERALLGRQSMLAYSASFLLLTGVYSIAVFTLWR
jgi:hypothetical protein